MIARYVKLLATTSRTFLVPIMKAPEPLQSAIGSAYLCMRAIDEVEDHPGLPDDIKERLLLEITHRLRAADVDSKANLFDSLFQPFEQTLPEVTLKLGELMRVAPPDIRSEVIQTTADMAEQMAAWSRRGWNLHTREDLDLYTFDVAGRVGLLLSKMWKWFENITTSEEEAIGFGRTLQSVNILRNRNEDALRGVDYFPDGWEMSDMMGYARAQMDLADRYMTRLPRGASYDFCILPLALARETLDALDNGKEKLSRTDVMKIVATCYK